MWAPLRQMVRANTRLMSNDSLRVSTAAINKASSALVKTKTQQHHQHRQNRFHEMSSYGLVGGAAVLAGGSTALCAGDDEGADDGEDSEENQEKRTTFRDSKFLAYEDRIRLFSTPDKKFRYFATIRIDGTVYMKPEDFIRSIHAGSLQPKEYGLDVYEDVENPAQFDIPTKAVQKTTLFSHTDDGVLDNCTGTGLITYSEYLFLLTVLSASQRSFELAFKMFDLDGNGVVDIEEFGKVQQAVQAGTSAGRKLHGTHTTSSPKEIVSRSHLMRSFFGDDGKKKLKFEEFTKYVDDLQRDIEHLDFLRYNRKEDDRNSISPRNLAQMLLAYAHVDGKQRPAYLHRIKNRYSSISAKKKLTFSHVLEIFGLIRAIDDFGTCLHLYTSGGCNTSVDDFRRAAKIVLERDVSEDTVQFIFALFDVDGDGELDDAEFIRVFQNAQTLGAQTKETRVWKGLSGLIECIKERMAKE